MCEVTRKFKLCSCSTAELNEPIHNKNSRRYKNHLKQNNPGKIVWSLYKYEGKEYSGMDGMLIAPADKLDEVFTAEYVKKELNNRNCFDFDYSPKEGDYLELKLQVTDKKSKREDIKFMPFIFTNGQWTINYYNSFYEKTVEIHNGKVDLE